MLKFCDNRKEIDFCGVLFILVNFKSDFLVFKE